MKFLSSVFLTALSLPVSANDLIISNGHSAGVAEMSTAQNAINDNHHNRAIRLKQSVSVAYMTTEDALRLAESYLYKEAFEICDKVIAIRASNFKTTWPSAYTVTLEADFHCGF